MSETNLDHLLQVTAPRADWTSANASRGREQQSGFGDHLHQAAAPQPSGPTSRAYDRQREQNAAQNAAPTKSAAQSIDDHQQSDDDSSVSVALDTAPPPVNSASAGNEGAATDAAVHSEATDKVANETDAVDHAGESSSVDANELSAAAALIGVETVALDQVDEQAAAQSASDVDDTNSADRIRADDRGNEELSTDVKQRLAGAQLITPVGDPATFNYVLDPETLATPEDGHTITLAANEQLATTAQIVKRHRPATPGPERVNGRQGSESSELAATENAEIDQSAASTPSNPDTKPNPSSDEPRDKTNFRDIAIGLESRAELSTTRAKTAEGAAMTAATADAAAEIPTPDVPQETNRLATPSNSARGDALLQPLVQLQRGASAAARGRGTSEGEELPRVDAARFVGRVARAFHTAQERGGALQLRLSPPELGAMRIELMVKDGVLSASLETETQSARRVLLDHLPALRDRLAEQNIRIEKFDVDVRRDGSGGQQQPAPQHDRDGQSPHWTPPRQPHQQPKQTQESARAAPPLGVRTTETQINLVA